MPFRVRTVVQHLLLAAGISLGASLLFAALVAAFPAEADAFLFIFILSVGISGYFGGRPSGLFAVAFALIISIVFAGFPQLSPRFAPASIEVLIAFAVVAVLSALIAGRLREVTLSHAAARAEAELMTARLRELQQVTAAPLASIRLDELLRGLLGRLTAILGVDTAAVLMLDETERVLEARAASGLEEEVERGTRVPLGLGFAGRIAEERHPVVMEDVQHADVLNPILKEKGIASLLGVPMVAQGGVIGVLHVGSLRRRSFSTADVQLLQLVADRMALLIENERLYQAEQRRAESLDALVKVATDIHAAVRIEDVMRAIAGAAQRLAGSGIAFAGFFRGRGEPDPTEYRQWEVAGVPRPMFERLDHLHITPLFEPTFRAQGTVRADDIRRHPLFHGLPEGHVPVISYLAVPVASRDGRSLGAILLGHPEPGRFDEHVQTQVESLARQAGVALENALLYERERSTAETLQRSLLPDRVPALPGITLAVRYLPSGTGEVGGDWYDVLDLGTGYLALVMGDVVGRGVPAAAVMGQLRNALRAYALEDAAPGAVAARLNALTDRFARPGLATLVYLLVDLGTLSVRYVRAGHLPPVLVHADGATELLEGGHTLPLGVQQEAVFDEGRTALRPGDTLLLYTDGLVDRRDVPLESALLLLRQSAAQARMAAPEILLEDLLGHVPVDAVRQDDIALLALHVVSSGDRLSVRVPAESASLATLRQTMRRWLAQQGVDGQEALRILIATGEAVGNAIEHAYGPSGGSVHVEALRDGDGVTVTVRDNGGWRPPRGRGRGRGLQVIESLMDDTAVSREQDGTRVRLHRRLRRDADA